MIKWNLWVCIEKHQFHLIISDFSSFYQFFKLGFSFLPNFQENILLSLNSFWNFLCLVKSSNLWDRMRKWEENSTLQLLMTLPEWTWKISLCLLGVHSFLHLKNKSAGVDFLPAFFNARLLLTDSVPIPWS